MKRELRSTPPPSEGSSDNSYDLEKCKIDLKDRELALEDSEKLLAMCKNHGTTLNEETKEA